MVFFLFVFVFLVSFTLKGVGKFYSGNQLLETLMCLQFISATPTLGDFLRAAVINRNHMPCKLEVLVSLFGQVVVTGNIYRRVPGRLQSMGSLRVGDD